MEEGLPQASVHSFSVATEPMQLSNAAIQCSYSSNAHLSQSLLTGMQAQPSWVICAGSVRTCQGQLNCVLAERLHEGEIAFKLAGLGWEHGLRMVELLPGVCA